MGLRKIMLLCSLLLSWWAGTMAQSSQGTDFWVAFMQNNDGINESERDKYFFDLDLVLSAKRACEVQISCDSSGFFRSYSLEDNASQTVSIPFVNFNIDVYGKAIKRTLHITSTDTISVYAANSQFCSMEATLILPTSACGSYYVTQTNTVRRNGYKYKYSPVIFSVLAFEDDTEVEIVPALLTGAGQPGGQPFTITLNKGEVYAVETDKSDAGLDFSGSQIRVKDDKKVAVYVGSRSACVPESNLDGDSDNLWDVAYPVSSWGKRFMIVPMRDIYYELIKITAADKGAVVSMDGETLAELKPYQSYEFVHAESDGAFTLESSEPVEVYQYMTSNQYKRVDNYRGPSYQYVAPLEQAIEEVTFSTFNTKGISYHYLNFLVKEEDKTSVTLDGKNDEFSFSSVEGAPGYLFTSMQIAKGSHVLKAPHGVVANVYGRGKDISYAYSAGSSMAEINPVEMMPSRRTGEYKVVYDGNGATAGSMESHVYEIGLDETTTLDPNKYERSYAVTFDAQGGEDVETMKMNYQFAGWLHESMLTDITNNMEKNWNYISTDQSANQYDLIKLSMQENVNYVSVSTRSSIRERLYSMPIYMPEGDYDLSLRVCSPTGYVDLGSEWSNNFKCSACGEPQQVYCNDQGLLTKETEKSAALLECHEASEEMVDRNFTVFATGETPVYIAINCGNLKDGKTYEFRFSDFVLRKADSTPMIYLDKEMTKNMVREDSGIVSLKAIWVADSLILPSPTRAGYQFLNWNTEANGSGISYAADQKIAVDADIKLYAMWEVSLDVCANGTILFREDFGGNYESDPKVQSVDLPSGVTTLTHQPNFPLATNLGGYNSGRSGCYDIRKTGYHRVNNYGGAYADWYLDFDDHTSPDDEERGYIMQVDMASSATTFYNVQIDGLCANTQLYLSMWGHPVNKYSDAEIQLIVEDLEGNQLTAEKAVISCRLNEWQQVGTYFTVPEKNTSVVYRIFSEGGLNGNDFALDDIEVRLCKPGVEVNKPTDTLCVGSDFTMKAAFVNKGNVYVEPVNYTWFKNEKSGYAADGWEQVATGDSLELKDLKISDNGFYKVIVSSKGVEGVMDKCNSSSDAVELRVATCSPEPTCLPLSSTQGKDFWVAIPRGSDAYVKAGESYYMNLILTSSLPCKVQLDADELDYHKEVELTGNVSVTLELPFEKFNITQNDIALKKALHVTSGENVSVYISNYQKCSLDASEILPTSATGSYYIVQTYNSMDNNGTYTFTPTEFVIVGEEDSTKIEITPTINTTGGQEGGKPYVITLNQGEVYQVRSTEGQQGLDFSGTVVKSLNGEHFSVISGHAAGRVPMETSGDADLMIETLYPVDSWGSKFVIKAEKGGYYDFIRCTAEKDSTKIFVDGELKTTINALETYEFEIQEGDPAIYMESSFPVEVYQYMSGNNWRTHRNDGGPSSMYVAPVDQAIKKVTFVAYDKGTVTKNYLNVVAKTDEVDQVLLDGKGDFATFEAVAYNPDYSVAVLDIEKGSHTLEAPSGVIANVYGLGYSLSYAYLVGSSMNKINGSEVVKDTICVGDEYLFAGKTYNKTGFYTDTVVSAMGCDSLVFLDLTVANCVVCVPTEAHITETICNGAEYVSLTGIHYTKAGVYCDTIQNKAGCDSLVYLSLKVLAAKNEVLLDSAEYGSYYKKYGFEVDFVSWGSHEYSRVEKSVDGCDSVVTLILTGYYDLSSCETVEFLTKETICQGESYVFYDRTLTESGRYKETFQVKCTPVEAVDGVRFKDSVIVLDLTVLPNQLVEISDVAYWNESYAGHGFSVEKLEEMGDFKYTATYPAENGCDSTVILTLTVKERPMFIPTAFTPHFEDDMNDHFMPGYEVFIYDRYGNLVCHSEDGWDGTYRGKVATAGIYVYSLIMKDGQIRKGTIEVVKSK